MRSDGKHNKRAFTGLQLKKLSVVSNPAQSHALARIIKSAADGTNKGEPADMKYKKELAAILGDAAKEADVMKGLDDLIAKSVADAVAAKMAEIETEKAKEAEEAKKAAEEEARKAADTVEIGGQKVAKSSVPEEVLKAMETLEKQRLETEKKMSDLQKQLDMEACVKEAESKYPHIAGTPAEKGQLMYSLKSLDPVAKAQVETALAKANSIMGDQFGVVGYGYHPEPTEKTSDLDLAIKAMGGK